MLCDFIVVGVFVLKLIIDRLVGSEKYAIFSIMSHFK